MRVGASWVALAFAAGAVAASCRSSGGRVSAPAGPPPPASQATPAPSPSPAVPTTVEAPSRDDPRAPLVRVLLQAPGDPLFPEPGRRYACIVADTAALLRGPLIAKAVGGRAAIQVGAFADPGNAQAALVRLQAAGVSGEIQGEREDLRRVVALAREGQNADELASQLTGTGFADQKRAAPTTGAAVQVQGEGEARVSGERIRVVPLDPAPVRIGGKTVRGEFELRPGKDGVAAINVVNLEEYLRGVVPAEMGPRTFPIIEALKAQAVAARTYAVAHLGEHVTEGYDLCDTPFCQAYEGTAAEHPLSDRAVRETQGEVLTFQGRPIDAMYHSTCAGHTEDGGALFPPRDAPYLKGVPCRGERELSVGAGTPAGAWFASLERLALVGERIATTLGVSAQPRALATRLTGRVPAAGLLGLVQAFDLPEASRILQRLAVPADEETVRALFALFRMPLPAIPRGSAKATSEMATVVRLAQLAGTVQAISGRLLPSPGGVLLVSDGTEATHDLTGNETLLERHGERWRRNGLVCPAGSPATLWCAGGICPVLEVEPLNEADAGSAWSWWVRELSLEEIGRRLGVAGVREVSVTRRGISGRALAVRVVANGAGQEFPGIAFRRALDLPDTLFVPLLRRDALPPSVRFLGRGWGHGVGMCQNGAYGLARGGADYREILKTYYTGVEIGHCEGGKP